MNFALSEDQRLIRESARALFAARGGSTRLRAALEAGEGLDPELWNAIGHEMGWLGVAVPERLGGSGLGHVELAILMEEAGRVLAFTPFFVTAGLAIPLILAAADDAQQAALLPDLASGAMRAAVCLTGPSGDPAPGGVSLELTNHDAGWRLDGESCFVAFAPGADLLIAVARTSGSGGWDGLSLVALPVVTRGVAVEACPSLDLTRPYGRIRFDNVVVDRETILGEPGQAGPAIRRGLDVAAVMLAAEQLGSGEAVLEKSIDHAKHRVQFGRPIGAFQAIKHKLADMTLWMESARSAVYFAACVCDEAPDALAEAAAVARIYASEAHFRCAGEAIQVHGGIGFTWEHDAHLHFRRARASAGLLGGVDHHRERIAVMMGLGPLQEPSA